MNVLRSVRFNILLGLLITVASAVGTLLPQLGDAPEKVAAYQVAHPFWYKVFDLFSFFDLYHSWWFMGALGLMAFDVVLCKLMNRPPDHGLVSLPPEMTDEQKLEHLAQKDAGLKLKPFQAAIASGLPPKEAAKAARDYLSIKGYAPSHEISTSGGETFVATRHSLQRWGSYVSHIALVVILTGALLKGLFGFVEMVPVLEGRSRGMQNKPGWEVFVDKFSIDYYQGTTNAKRFSSELRVEKNGVEIGKKTIIVNDPLDIGGVRFYQASYGAGGMFRSVKLKVGRQIVQLPMKTPEKIEGTPFTVEADLMLPNFTITQGQADNASLDIKNPAVRFQFSVGPHKTHPVWLLQYDPDVSFAEDENGNLLQAGKPPFEIAGLDPVLFSGIQVAYDPGFKVVLTGALMWLFGMICLFYLHRRRLWLVVEPDGRGSRVSIGGWSSRGESEYTREFESLTRALRRPLKAEDDDLKVTEVSQK